MLLLYLRYVHRVPWPQELAAFPKTVKRRNDGARYNTVEDLKQNHSLQYSHLIEEAL